MNRYGLMLVFPLFAWLARSAVPAVQDENCLLYPDVKVTASDAASGDLFGASVDVHGEWAGVGAPLVDDAATDAGAVYVLRDVSGTFVEQQKLVPPVLGAGDRFGASVALHDDLLVAGAPFHDGALKDAGAAFVYRWDGALWQQEQMLLPLDAGHGDEFGHDVAVEGSTILVSAWRYDDRVDSGWVLVFEYDGFAWSETQRLRASDGAAGARFGSAVALEGDALAIGAMRHGGAAFQAGAAYVFRHDGTEWLEEQLLIPPGLGMDDQLGEVIDLNGDVVVIGARFDDDLGTDSGAAYVYRHDGNDWMLDQKLLPDNGADGDEFGAAVAVFEGSCVVGSRVGNNLGAQYGGAYLFSWDGVAWRQQQHVIPQPLFAYGNDQFGWGVAMDRDSCLIAANQDDDAATDAGAVHLHRRACDPCRLRREVQTLVAPAGGAFFASLLAADASHLLVSAPTGTSAPGPVHAYRRQSDQWVYLAALVPSLATPPASIAVQGDTAVIGQDSSSRVHVFRFDGVSWSESQVLRPSDGVPGDLFGSAVAVHGSTLMVGAPEHYTPGIGEGAVYVFEFDGVRWDEVQKLVAINPLNTSKVGRSLDLEATRLVVGSMVGSAGAVFVFEYNGAAWLQTAKIEHPTQIFAPMLSLSGDTFAVASLGMVHVYRHTGSNWVEEPVILSPVLGPNARVDSLTLDGQRLLVGSTTSDFFGRLDGVVEGYWFDGSRWRVRWLLRPAAGTRQRPGYGQAVAIAGDDLLVGELVQAVHRFRPDPALFAGPSPLQVSEQLTMRLCDAATGQVGLVALVDVSGVSLFQPVLRGLLDSNRELTEVMTVPPGLEGLSVQLVGIATDCSTAKVVLTNTVRVQFE